MKTIHLLFFSLFILPCTAQNCYTKYWDKSFGGNMADSHFNNHTSNSGSIYLVSASANGISGNKTIDNCGGYDFWVLKLDASGQIVWQIVLGGHNFEEEPFLNILSDGNLILVGEGRGIDTACNRLAVSHSNNTRDIWAIKIDTNGNRIWDMNYGSLGNELQPNIVELSNGQLMLLCSTTYQTADGDRTAPGKGGNDTWVVKINANGSKVWDRVYGGIGGDVLNTAVADDHGNCILVGSTSGPAGGDISDSCRGGNDAWIIKIDSSGNKVWDKRYGGLTDETISHAERTADNGFILCGETTSPQSGDVSEPKKGSGIFNTWVIKLDSLGNKQWDHRYGGGNYTIGAFYWGTRAKWIVHDPSGGYVFCGYTDDTLGYDMTDTMYLGGDFFVIKIDDLGNKIWDKRFGGMSYDDANSIAFLSDTSMVVAGPSGSDVNGNRTFPRFGVGDNWVIRFRMSSSPLNINDVVSDIGRLILYPNPSDGIVRYHSDLKTLKSITVYDALGKVVMIQDNQISIDIDEIDLSKCSSGLYTIRLCGTEGERTGRILRN